MDDIDLDTPGGRLKWARLRATRQGARDPLYPDAIDFAKALKLNDKTYRAYENNQNGYAKHVTRFAKALGVRSDWLLEGGDPQETAASSKAAGADTQPQPWLPKEATLIRLVRAAENAASEGPARTIDVPKFARGLLAGLRMIAAKPTSEDDPGFLAAVETQIVIAIHDYAAPIEQSA